LGWGHCGTNVLHPDDRLQSIEPRSQGVDQGLSPGVDENHGGFAIAQDLLGLGGFESRIHTDDRRAHQLQPKIGNDPGPGVLRKHGNVRPPGDARFLQPPSGVDRRRTKFVVREGEIARYQRRARSPSEQCLSDVAAAKEPAGGLGFRRNLAAFLSMDRPRRPNARRHLA
jgi:hypothetical protein